MALLFVECPDGFQGAGASRKSGVQFPSPAVKSFPSTSPLQMAGCGRQKL